MKAQTISKTSYFIMQHAEHVPKKQHFSEKNQNDSNFPIASPV
jgi:hypothetical protein